MKYLFTFIIFLIPFLILNAQTTYVPDNNFEQVLIDLGLDDVLDDYVLTSNISGLIFLDLQSRNISDLTGLQDFASLRYFDASNNQFSYIPLHPNANFYALTANNNQLTELDLSQHTNLTELACANNFIANFDLSQNSNLMYLSAGQNSFPELDVSNHPNLREVRFFGQNTSLVNVDVRNGNNPVIQEFVVLNSPNLPYIFVDDCVYSTVNWTDIDPTTNFVEMEGQTECILGIEEQTPSNFNLYPNPAKNNINIQATETQELVQVYSIQGILAKETSRPDIDVSNLASGLYFVKVYIQGNSITKKFIKN